MTKRIIYCDMDGVLCDFMKRFIELAGCTIDEYAEKYSWSEAWDIIENDGVSYWSELSWMPGGKKLWNFIKGMNTEILTATPHGTPEVFAKEGKIIWCDRELLVNVKVNTIVGGQNKYKFIKNKDILIDDLERNCENWNNAGGFAILHKDADTTIKELIKLL